MTDAMLVTSALISFALAMRLGAWVRDFYWISAANAGVSAYAQGKLYKVAVDR